MDINYYKQFEPIDGKWYINKELGSGAFGKVFEIERRDFSNIKAALKVVSIPNSQNEFKSFRDDNFDMDDKSVTSYFYGFVEEFVKEFQVMSRLKGHTNIVSYEDHDVKEKKDGFGWDIFIRMELLTPMNEYFRMNTPRQSDVIKIGIDICKALEVCQKYNIIHRDIKPSNIFVSENGDFKLGDFGVARTLEKTSSGLSKKGTYTYMAPEVYKGEKYNSNVDIYSLGILMYKLLNNNMEPFRTDKTYSDGEKALSMRMSGEEIPVPSNAEGRLAEIVLKACRYNPKERYESPVQMRTELEKILYGYGEAKVVYPNGDEIAYEPSASSNFDVVNEKTESIFAEQNTKENTETAGMFFNKNRIDELDDNTEETVSLFSEKNTAVQNEKNYAKQDNKNGSKSGKRGRRGVLIGIAALVVMIITAGIFLINNYVNELHTKEWYGDARIYKTSYDGFGWKFIDDKNKDDTGVSFSIDSFMVSDGLISAIKDGEYTKTVDDKYVYTLTQAVEVVSYTMPETTVCLDEKYEFKYELMVTQKPYAVHFVVGEGVRDPEWQYDDESGIVSISVTRPFESKYYSIGDDIKIELIVVFENTDESGVKTTEKFYLDHTDLKVVEKQ